MRPLLTLITIAALAACGSVQGEAHDDARPLDAAEPDAAAPDAAPPDAAPPIDAGVDAPADAAIDAPPPLPGQELTGGAGRIAGTIYTMDVQLGHPLGQQPIQSTTYQLQANTPIKP